MNPTAALARARNSAAMHPTKTHPARRRRTKSTRCGPLWRAVEALEQRRLLSAGGLDPTFGAGGMQTLDFGYNDVATATAVQSDGKILVAGYDDGGSADFAVARFNPDGSLDTSFNPLATPDVSHGNGKQSFTFGTGTFGGVEKANAIALQSDGKIVLAGFTDAGGVAGNPDNFAIARLNPNGTLDTTFNGTGKQTIDFGYNDQATCVAIQSDGKIVVGGFDDGGSADFAVARLNSDGSLDATFNPLATPDISHGNGKQSFTFGTPPFGGVEKANALALQPDGKIVLAGFTDAGGTAGSNPHDFAIARLNTNGTLDTTFHATGKQTINFGYDDQATNVAVRNDGKILVGGFDDGGSADFAVARLNSDGSLDTSFNPLASPDISHGNGKQSFTFGAGLFGGVEKSYGMALRADGTLVMAGFTDAGGSGHNNFAIAQLAPDGILDTRFNGTGKQITDWGSAAQANAVAIQADGSVVVAGTASGNFAVARYQSTPYPPGTPDWSFNLLGQGRQSVDFGFNDTATATVVQSDGKILVAGYDDGGAPDFAVARLNPDGSLDTSFNPTATPTNYNGNGKASFTFGAGLFGGVEKANAIALQSDGKIVLAGFTDAGGGGGAHDFAVARLNANGTLDTTFNGTGKQTIDFGYDDQATCVAIQSDGKILVGGFDDGGSADFAVARLNSDGSLDATFNPLATPDISHGNGKQSFTFGAGTFGGVEKANAIALQPDGKIVLAGFTDAGGTAGSNPHNFAIARLNANGTLDTSFDTTGKQTVDFGYDDQATSVAVRNDGKILVGGFDDGGFADFAVARLNPDGSLDASFNPLATPDISHGNGKQSFTFGTPPFGGVEKSYGMALRADGTLVMAGFTDALGNGHNSFAVAQLAPDGTLDTRFNGTGKQITDWGSAAQANAVAIQADGSVVVAGTANGNFAVARYLDVKAGSIFGNIFNDANYNKIRDAGEGGLAGVTVYIDANNNGVLDAGEISTTTDPSGNYEFFGLPAGINYVVRQIAPTGYRRTTPLSPAATVAVTTASPSHGPVFGDVKTSTVLLDFNYLVILARHYGQPGTFADGDLNDDGTVNFADLVLLARNYGHSI